MKIQKLFTWVIYTVCILFLITVLSYTGYSAPKKTAEKNDKPAEVPFSTEKFEAKQYDIGFSAGFWLPGTITIEDVDVDKEIGPLIRIFYDSYINPKFAVGGYFNYSSAVISYETLEANADFLEIGIAFKPRFFIGPDMALKPGLNIGYRMANRELLMGYEAADTNTKSKGMGVNLSVELQFMQKDDYIFFVESGFITQPTGGNSNADVTWGPILYLTCGLAF
jgi:hypothetical protein